MTPSGWPLPAAYLVIAAFVVPLPALVLGGSVVKYLASSLGFLLGIALVGFGAIAAFKRAPGRLLDTLLRPLPVLGATWRELDYWSFTRTLAFLSRTSIGVLAAVRLAIGACRSPRLAGALRAAVDQAEAQGAPLSSFLRATGELPPDLVALWQTGEQSGQLDETFRRVATHFAERCRHRLAELAAWTPRIAYFAVVIYLAWQTFSFVRASLGS